LLEVVLVGGVRASDATPLKEMVREALDLKMMQHYEGMHSPLVDKVKALEARVADLEKKLDIIRQAGLTLEEFRELV
jgi:hypothetical protein